MKEKILFSKGEGRASRRPPALARRRDEGRRKGRISSVVSSLFFLSFSSPETRRVNKCRERHGFRSLRQVNEDKKRRGKKENWRRKSEHEREAGSGKLYDLATL